MKVLMMLMMCVAAAHSQNIIVDAINKMYQMQPMIEGIVLRPNACATCNIATSLLTEFGKFMNVLVTTNMNDANSLAAAKTTLDGIGVRLAQVSFAYLSCDPSQNRAYKIDEIKCLINVYENNKQNIGYLKTIFNWPYAVNVTVTVSL